MARYQLPSGSGSANPSAPIVDTNDKVVAITISNPSAVDGYVSEQRTELDNTVPGTNAPSVGTLFPAAAPPTITILHIPRFKGKLYARAIVPGAALEVLENDIC